MRSSSGNVTAAPLVATHSNAHALCQASRNLTDTQLRAIGDSGGVVGVNFAVTFLREDGFQVSFSAGRLLTPFDGEHHPAMTVAAIATPYSESVRLGVAVDAVRVDLLRAEAAAVVLDHHCGRPCAAGQQHGHVPRLCVLDHVRERLLHDPVGGHIDARR